MADAALSAKEQKKVEEIIEKLFAGLEIDGTFTVQPAEDTIDVVMDTRDTGIVIGYHGEALEALQLMLSLMIAKKLDRFLRISIEVDGYKKNRMEYLEKLAMEAKERAVTEQKEQVLMNLKSWERRIVHMRLQDDDQVVSESSGEGKDRVLLIKPK